MFFSVSLIRLEQYASVDVCKKIKTSLWSPVESVVILGIQEQILETINVDNEF